MHVYRYSFWKLLGAVVACVGFTYGGFWMAQEGAGRVAFAGYMLLALFPSLTLFFLRFLLSDRVVLRIDPRGIDYKTLFGAQRVVWRDFQRAAVETVTTSNSLGQSSSSRHLKLDFGKGFFGNCRISEALLETRAGGVEGMLESIRDCMSGAAALDRGDYRHPSLGQAAVRSNDTRSAPAASPVISGFGRKGL